MKKQWMARYALCAALLPAVALGSVAIAQTQPYAAALERTEVPDTTPQQRYQSAIREAGGGLKVGLEECRAQAQARKSCEAQARARFQADMAQANGGRHQSGAASRTGACLPPALRSRCVVSG